MDDLTQRVRYVVDSLLENEGLTADLDDVAAQVLLDWGIACAKRIARSTMGLDDLEAEEAMADRLRATRRLMRLVDRWIACHRESDTAADRDALARIFGQAAIIYGKEAVWPDEVGRDVFFRQHAGSADDPGQAIEDLRRFIEDPGDNGRAQSGESSG